LPLAANAQVDFVGDFTAKKTEPKVTEWFDMPLNSLSVTNLNMNTEDLELGGMIVDGKLYFSLDRYDEKGLNFSKTREPHLDIFEAVIDENGEVAFAKHLRGDINSHLHEGFCSITPDGSTMYFSLNQRKGLQRAADENNISQLKICKAEKIEGTWTNVEELLCNVDGYSLSLPTISRDGSKLFFTGEMPGGYGEKICDIANFNKMAHGELRSIWGQRSIPNATNAIPT